VKNLFAGEIANKRDGGKGLTSFDKAAGFGNQRLDT